MVRLAVKVPDSRLFEKCIIEEYLPVRLTEDCGEVKVTISNEVKRGSKGVVLGSTNRKYLSIKLYAPAINATVASKYGVRKGYSSVLLHELCHLLLDPIVGDVHGLPHEGPCALKPNLDAYRPCCTCRGFMNRNREAIVGVARKIKTKAILF